MKKTLFLLTLLVYQFSNAQHIVTLENCYALAIQNYPLAKQSEFSPGNRLVIGAAM